MAARLGAGVSPRNGCRVWSGQGEGSTARPKSGPVTTPTVKSRPSSVSDGTLPAI